MSECKFCKGQLNNEEKCVWCGFLQNGKDAIPGTLSYGTKLENYVLVPALVLDTFMTYCKVDSLKENYNLILYCLLLLAVGLCIAIPLSKPFSKEKSLTEEEQIVLKDWAHGKSIANTSMMHHMSERTVRRIRQRLRAKYDSIQCYTDLPPRK